MKLTLPHCPEQRVEGGEAGGADEKHEYPDERDRGVAPARGAQAAHGAADAAGGQRAAGARSVARGAEERGRHCLVTGDSMRASRGGKGAPPHSRSWPGPVLRAGAAAAAHRSARVHGRGAARCRCCAGPGTLYHALPCCAMMRHDVQCCATLCHAVRAVPSPCQVVDAGHARPEEDQAVGAKRHRVPHLRRRTDVQIHNQYIKIFRYSAHIVR